MYHKQSSACLAECRRFLVVNLSASMMLKNDNAWVMVKRIHLNNLLNHLNRQHPSIQFTHRNRTRGKAIIGSPEFVVPNGLIAHLYGSVEGAVLLEQL